MKELSQLVAALFYGCGYSYKEVSAFLKIPITKDGIRCYTPQEGGDDGRSRRATVWQLPAGGPGGTGRLCRGLFGAACTAHAASGGQGAAHPPDRPRGRALLPGSRDDC